MRSPEPWLSLCLVRCKGSNDSQDARSPPAVSRAWNPRRRHRGILLSHQLRGRMRARAWAIRVSGLFFSRLERHTEIFPFQLWSFPSVRVTTSSVFQALPTASEFGSCSIRATRHFTSSFPTTATRSRVSSTAKSPLLDTPHLQSKSVFHHTFDEATRCI